MKLIQSSSIRKRILFAFSLVVLPLIVGLAAAILSIQKLGTQGQLAVLNAANTVQYSRLLLEELPDMERNALQYRVLHDPSLYALYVERHQQFQQTSADFSRLNLNDAMREKLNELSTRELVVFNNFSKVNPNSADSSIAVAQFEDLNNLARSILAQGTQSIATEINNMQTAASRHQRQLAWLAAILILLAFLLALVFIVHITRPIRAIDQAIRKLGAGELATPILVQGPRDLEELGKRLDWLRARLLELEEHRVRFLRHISHELKTPLTNIREGTQLLTEQVVGPLNPEQLEIAQILNKNGLQLQKRIEDLLNFSAAQGSRIFKEDQLVKFNRVVTKVVEEQKMAIKAKHIKIDARLREATVLADAEEIRIVVDNLLSNAIKYSPTGGTIRLFLKVKDGQAVLHVKDQGPGIRPDEKEKIFEAFYQGQDSNSGYVKGTGLGLSIAREYMRVHHGVIEIVEQQKGAHFRVALPAARLGV
ncbi:MAG: HAMP domain-containing sensor histidine kinase [Gammaproteobacteria bacterium]